MKAIKRKAKRISDRPIKKKAIDRNMYVGSEEALLNKVLEIVVKIIKKEIACVRLTPKERKGIKHF